MQINRHGGSAQIVKPKEDFGSWLTELSELVGSAQNTEEVKLLLQELLSPSELKAICERWQIVRMLLQGKTQREVRDQLNCAIATVSRGARALQVGRGAFKQHYQRLHGEKQNRKTG